VLADVKIRGKTEPRLFTPPLRELVPGDSVTGEGRTTDGYSVIRFAHDCLHINLYPWQEWLLIHGMELLPDGTYRFRVVIIEVARQNGKTILESVLALWFLYTAQEPRTVIGTAQNLPNAARAWSDAIAFAENDDELAEFIEDDSIYLGHPQRLTLSTGSEYLIQASSDDGGRGWPADLILLDELRQHRNWDSWSSIKNTTNARPKAQVWCFSNAGDARSVVLRHQRAMAHRDLGWPDGEQEFDGVLDDLDEEIAELLADSDDLKPGWFEYSAPPGAKRNELEALAQSNPSLNHTEVTDKCPTTRTLLSALSDPAYVYETEVMCRWPIFGTGGPFPEGSWAATAVADPEDNPAAEDTKRVICVEVSVRRSHTFICLGGLTTDGKALIGITYDRPGTEWVVETIVADHKKKPFDGVIIRTDTDAPVRTMLQDLIDAGLNVVEWKGSDIFKAHGLIFDRLMPPTPSLLHLTHTGLDIAATSAVEDLKPGGGSRVSIRRSPTDTAPLYAAIGVVWGLAEVTAYNVLESVW